MSWDARLRDERGYTLVELMLATAAGLVVCVIALTIVLTSLHFATADADRVDSNQQGSFAMEKIVQALTSSCVAGLGSSPVIGSPASLTGTGPYLITTPRVPPYTVTGGGPASSASSITFLSTVSDLPNADPNEVTIYLSGSGSLMMATYPAVITTPPSWTFAASPSSTVTLLARAALAPGQSGIFSYYGYNVSNDALVDNYTVFPLTQAEAADVAKVGIQFQAQPTDTKSQTGSAVNVADTVALRLSAATNTPSTQTTPTPCA
jgi:Tfp pilus assembly protein PilW